MKEIPEIAIKFSTNKSAKQSIIDADHVYTTTICQWLFQHTCTATTHKHYKMDQLTLSNIQSCCYQENSSMCIGWEIVKILTYLNKV